MHRAVSLVSYRDEKYVGTYHAAITHVQRERSNFLKLSATIPLILIVFSSTSNVVFENVILIIHWCRNATFSYDILICKKILSPNFRWSMIHVRF